MKKVLVISTHLDDAILSAGQFIAGRGGNVDVLTVFSGIPMKKKLLTQYDKSCGFKNSKDAMVVRRQEDMEACAILNARPLHTKYLDSQYTDNFATEWIADLLELVAICKYEMILAPLGLRHPDHIDVANNVSMLGLDNLYFYEDLPHRVTNPELVFERLDHFELERNKPVFLGDGPIADKVRALWCYKSQMGRGDLNPYNLFVTERFWKA